MKCEYLIRGSTEALGCDSLRGPHIKKLEFLHLIDLDKNKIVRAFYPLQFFDLGP